MSRFVLCFVAAASAFQMPAMSRRDFARAVAIAPLAAVAPVFADSNNVYLGNTYPTGIGAGNVDKYGVPTKAVGSPPTVDIAGAAIGKNARYPTSSVAFKGTRPGEQSKNKAQETAFARLLAK